MKTLTVSLFIALTAIAISQARTVEGISGLSKAQVKELNDSANTPQQHFQLAQYYRAQYNNFIEESRTYAAMANEYYRNPASHPIPKFPTYGDHYRSLSRQCLKDANKAGALARAHERMAAAASAGASK
jgi:hypothetical protein